jgi:glycosyltransferase involved in cell wall biosynthesis
MWWTSISADMKISLVVIARNEETTIARCLGSADFCDEMIVVLNDSEDRTAKIARELGAHVVETPDWPGFGPQKAFALSLATGEWVLSLDADEWLDESARGVILKVLADPGVAGFELRRISRFCGKTVRYGSWNPDYVLRLLKRDAGRFSDDIVHERIIVSGRLGRLDCVIHHDSIKDVEDASDKIARYSSAGAKQLAAQGKTSWPGKAFLRGLWSFLNSYFVRQGFRDGATGIRVAMYQAGQAYQKWLRLAKMNRAFGKD